MYNPYDHYFKQAKKQWYKARSIFKLEEIDNKYNIFTKQDKIILDIWCAPWSWTQFAYKRVNDLLIKDYKIVWFDIKDVTLNLWWVYTYNHNITDYDGIGDIIKNLWIDKFDIIISDMAPNTMWFKDIDAMRSISLLEKTMPIYQRFLKEWWKFVIKIFMGPWFDEFVKMLRDTYWWKNIKIFKPKAVRSESKEIYLIKL